MAIVLRRFDDERARLLGALGDLVTDQFGGEVTRSRHRRYMARNPSSDR